MSGRARRTGVTLEAQVEELEGRLDAMGDELTRLETEHGRFRVALGRIRNGESNPWAIAQDALHPPPDDEPA